MLIWKDGAIINYQVFKGVMKEVSNKVRYALDGRSSNLVLFEESCSFDMLAKSLVMYRHIFENREASPHF